MKLMAENANELIERNDEIDVADAAAMNLYRECKLDVIYDNDGEFCVRNLAGFHIGEAQEQLDAYVDFYLRKIDEPSRDEQARAAHENDEFTNYYWANQPD